MIGRNLLAERYHALDARRIELERQYDDEPTPVAEGRLVAINRKLSACRRAIRMERESPAGSTYRDVCHVG